MTTTSNPATFNFAASVGASRWYGFTTRDEAMAWAEENANGRTIQVVPACLADKVVAP